jgi:formate hydrogenlyase subunit 3/multisubunit Na+/H+ antiporter MnhD subunit
MNGRELLTSAGLPLAVMLPMGAALLALALSYVWKRAGSYLALAATALDLLLVGTMLQLQTSGAAQWMGGWDPAKRAGLSGVALFADGFTLLMLALVAAISFLVTIYALAYMEPYTARNRFFALFLMMIAGMNGCLVAGDLFTFWIFLEVASLASYALVGFGTESEQLEAAFKYLVLGALGSVFFLFGMVLTWGAFGTLNMADLAGKLKAIGGLGSSPIMLLVAAFFLLGVGLKAAMVPFHAWLPDAHPSAPTPISAMLSGLIIKVLGIYAFARIFMQVLGGGSVGALGTVVVWLGVLSMVVGVFLAVGQWDFKRLLAYHSISQMGYVIGALGLAMVLTSDLKGIDGHTDRIDREASSRREELARKTGTLREIELFQKDIRAGKTPQEANGLSPEQAGLQNESEVPMLRANVGKLEARISALEAQRVPLVARKPALTLAMSLAILGALFHLVNHAFFKSLLFLCAGAFERATGTRNLKELGGLWTRMPTTSASCAIAALSISGVPPLNGFWSKLLIVWAAALAGHWALAAVAVAVSFMTLISFVKVQKYALFGPASARVLRGVREVAWPMRFAMVALAAGCLLLGVLVMFRAIVPELLDPAVQALGGGPDALQKIFTTVTGK